MAKKDFYVDIDLLGNQIKNFAIEKIDNLDAIEDLPVFDGRTVYNKDDGHLYVYSVNPEDPSTGSWEIQARYEDIEKAIMEDPAILERIDEVINNSPIIQGKLDKINEPGKVYGTNYERDPETGEIIIDPETGEPVVIQTAYDIDSFGKVDDVKVNGESVVTNKIANITLGTMASESKDDYVQTLIDNGVNGKAYIWNESDGGGVRYEKGDSKVFVGVHSDEDNGEFVSIYAKDGNPENTKRLIIDSSGIYYIKGNTIEHTVNDELVSTSVLNEVRDELQAQIDEKDPLPERTPETNGQFLTNDGTDAFWGDLPEYTITKDSQAEQGYAHTYHLQKDGVNVGASINIPLDIFVESGEVKTCEQKDVPVEGYEVGDKYVDLTLSNSAQSHLYILISDLVDVYTGSTYIDIVDNQISLKYNELENQLKTDLVNNISLNDLKDVELTDVEDDQILVFVQNENENEGKWINKNRQSAIIRDWF